MSQFRHLIVRGDEFSHIKKGDAFPYIDCISEAGATGVHIWFWKEPYLNVKDEFIPYCRDRNIKVHLGIGVGAYDVCNGEDPTDPKVQQKIKDHVAKVLDTQDIDGIEFQTGEYDDIEYKGDSMKGISHARQLVDSLNPIVEYTHALKNSLWIRTELLMSMNHGKYQTLLAARSQGLLDPSEELEWIAATDCCDLCAVIDGARVPMDVGFGQYGSSYPPLHPNCRCTIGVAP